jgi:hypothetical protein
VHADHTHEVRALVVLFRCRLSSGRDIFTRYALRMHRFVIAVMLAGCSKSEPVPADCTNVGNGITKYWADRAETTTDADERAAIVETTKQAIAKMERHCRADHWSDDMIACARVVFRLDDSGCLKYLNAAQRAKLEEDKSSAPIPGGIGVGN